MPAHPARTVPNSDRRSQPGYIMKGLAITADDVDDPDQLATILKAVFETASNIATLENHQRHGNFLDEDPDLSPLVNLKNEEGLSMRDLEQLLPSLEIAESYQHEDWERGEPCPECGSMNITVIEPREYELEYYDDDVVHGDSGPLTGGDIDHYCQDCNITLSKDPAMELITLT